MSIRDEFNLTSITGNVDAYPHIVMKPDVKEILGKKYAVYGYRFEGLGQLYHFLDSNPEINVNVFGPADEVASITGDESFAGAPYPDALKQILNYHDPKYREFLDISKKVSTKDIINRSRFITVNTVSGGIIRPEALATGDPKIYRNTKVIKSGTEITINVYIGYHCGHSKEQVFNRAVILTNIIHALEKQNCRVKVNAFDVRKEDDELIEIILGIKGTNTSVNYQALYRSLCDVPFFRRLCFRLMECSDVKGGWRNGYGYSTERDICSELLKLKKGDLYFPQPDDMNIKGYDIEDDFEAAVRYSNLTDKIDVEKEKVKIKKGIQKTNFPLD